MMKFMKKQALAGASHTISQYEVSCFVNANTLIGFGSAYFVTLTKLVIRWFEQKVRDRRMSHPDLSRYSSIINWATLITAPKRASNAWGGDIGNCARNYSLCGRFVLCVGGRIRLYPLYERLIKDNGGNFVAFHGDSDDQSGDLPRLLREVDMIICPVDCVNHDDYFEVKNYCHHSGKPCVLLDRSEVRTFAAGVDTLSYIAARGLNKKECA